MLAVVNLLKHWGFEKPHLNILPFYFSKDYASKSQNVDPIGIDLNRWVLYLPPPTKIERRKYISFLSLDGS